MNLFGLTIIATSKYDKLYRESNEIGVRLSRCQSDINKLKESFKETVADRDAYMASLKRETERANAAEEKLKGAEEKADTLEKEMAEKDDKLLDMGKALSKERENYLLSVKEKEDLKQAVITAEKKAKEAEKKLYELMKRIEEMMPKNPTEEIIPEPESSVSEEVVNEESPYSEVTFDPASTHVDEEEDNWSPEGIGVAEDDAPVNTAEEVESDKTEENGAKEEARSKKVKNRSKRKRK